MICTVCREDFTGDAPLGCVALHCMDCTKHCRWCMWELRDEQIWKDELTWVNR